MHFLNDLFNYFQKISEQRLFPANYNRIITQIYFNVFILICSVHVLTLILDQNVYICSHAHTLRASTTGGIEGFYSAVNSCIRRNTRRNTCIPPTRKEYFYSAEKKAEYTKSRVHQPIFIFKHVLFWHL